MERLCSLFFTYSLIYIFTMSHTELQQHRDDWNTWSNYVLSTLKDLKSTTKNTDTKIGEIKLEMMTGMQKIITKITVLETKMEQKAAMTGGIVGFITSVTIGIIVFFITKS